jgi:hypothetical protein
MARARAAIFRFVSADLRREILRALFTDPLAEAMRQAALLGFEPKEITDALSAAQHKAVFSHWERKI